MHWNENMFLFLHYFHHCTCYSYRDFNVISCNVRALNKTIWDKNGMRKKTTKLDRKWRQRNNWSVFCAILLISVFWVVFVNNCCFIYSPLLSRLFNDLRRVMWWRRIIFMHLHMLELMCKRIDNNETKYMNNIN